MTGSTVYTVGANQKVLALNPTARQRGDAFPGEGEWQYPTEADRKVGTSFTAPVAANGTVYDRCEFDRVLNRALELSDYAGFAQRKAQALQRPQPLSA